ncbi:dephospho-CoA kinase [Flavobacteriaceae bacterium LMO-SS05]
MKIVGLTGGIGSGKTTVANMFKDLGVPIYIADFEAKNLMNTSKVIKRKLIELFGPKAYENNALNRTYIASKIFNDKAYLDKMNAIVHPKVAAHFKQWLQKQNSDYVVKEAAIIFEHSMQSQYDYIITVVAKKAERIKRVLNREATTKDKIMSIMKHQLSDDEKIKMSDFVIVNDNLEHTKEQVLKAHNFILKNLYPHKF